MEKELNAIVGRYKKRSSLPPNKYSHLDCAANLMLQEKQRVMLQLLKSHGIEDLANLKILEIGCGNGYNLLEFLQFGALPENLVGNELLHDRFIAARHCLPESTKLYFGDATKLQLPNSSFDIVYQSTVFSSILDDSLQDSLARKMWNLTRPGGGVLWYDFTFDNPNNQDVRGVKMSRVNKLFPDGFISVRKLTLAPPIARTVVSLHPSLYYFFNFLTFMRTHVLCYIKKL